MARQQHVYKSVPARRRTPEPVTDPPRRRTGPRPDPGAVLTRIDRLLAERR